MSAAADGEKVGLGSIRIRDQQLRASANTRSFHAAERVLFDWAVRHGGVLRCEFEIAYIDGHVLRGTYEFLRKGGSRPSLGRFVRALASNTASFLDRYDTEDFAAG